MRPPCVLSYTGAKDPHWIPIVAEQGWLIVTRDSAIQRRRAEVAAVRENGARMVALAGADAIGKWDQLEVLMVNWRRIQAWADQPGPFIYSVTRSRISPADPSRLTEVPEVSQVPEVSAVPGSDAAKWAARRVISVRYAAWS